jgi:hypothetical protein
MAGQRIRWAAAALVAVGVASLSIAAVFSSCSDDGLEERVAYLEANLNVLLTTMDQQQEQATRANLVATMAQLDAAKLHELNNSIIAGTVPDDAPDNVQKAYQAVASATWPQQLQATAEQLKADLLAMATALTNGNMDEVFYVSGALHGTYHTFGLQVWDYVSNDLPAEFSGGHTHPGITPMP